MVDRDLIPFAGNKSVVKRFKELDKKLISVLVVVSIGFSKIFEGFVGIFMHHYPVHLYGIDITEPIWWTIYTLFWLKLYLTGVADTVRDGVESVVTTEDQTTLDKYDDE